MIDTAKEQVFSLSDFAKELKKRRGIERSNATIRSWVTDGWSPRGCDEPVVVLESVPIMGAYHTSFEAFDRFLREQLAAKVAAEMAS